MLIWLAGSGMGSSYWVARSRTVHSHLQSPVLIWNLKLLVSRIVRRRASSLDTTLTVVDDGAILQAVCFV